MKSERWRILIFDTVTLMVPDEIVEDVYAVYGRLVDDDPYLNECADEPLSALEDVFSKYVIDDISQYSFTDPQPEGDVPEIRTADEWDDMFLGHQESDAELDLIEDEIQFRRKRGF